MMWMMKTLKGQPMNIILPSDTVYVTFNFVDENKNAPKTFSYKVKPDNVVEVLKKAKQEAEGFYAKLKLEDDVFGGVVFSFFEDKSTLFSSKKLYEQGSVENAAIRFVVVELLPAVNTHNFANQQPLIVFPPLGNENDAFAAVALTLEKTLAHVETFQTFSEQSKGSLIAPVEEYVKLYNVLPYQVVVNWGFTLRGLIRERHIVVEDETMVLFAEYASNMITKGIWGSHAHQLNPSDKTLTANVIFQKIHELTSKNFVEENDEQQEVSQVSSLLSVG